MLSSFNINPERSKYLAMQSVNDMHQVQVARLIGFLAEDVPQYNEASQRVLAKYMVVKYFDNDQSKLSSEEVSDCLAKTLEMVGDDTQPKKVVARKTGQRGRPSGTGALPSMINLLQSNRELTRAEFINLAVSQLKMSLPTAGAYYSKAAKAVYGDSYKPKRGRPAKVA